MEHLSFTAVLGFHSRLTGERGSDTCEISHSINEWGGCKGYTADVESVDLTVFIPRTLTSHQNEADKNSKPFLPLCNLLKKSVKRLEALSSLKNNNSVSPKCHKKIRSLYIYIFINAYVLQDIR